MALVLDTSAFYAYMVEKDQYHKSVSLVLVEALQRGERLHSSSFVLCETLGLLQIRHGVKASRLFMDKVFPAVEWRWVDRALFQRLWELAQEHSRRSFTLVDASVVACIEQLPGSVCVAVDDDLRTFNFPVLPSA